MIDRLPSFVSRRWISPFVINMKLSAPFLGNDGFFGKIDQVHVRIARIGDKYAFDFAV